MDGVRDRVEVGGWMDKVDRGEEETGLPQSKVGSVDKSPRLITRYYLSFCVCPLGFREFWGFHKN